MICYLCGSGEISEIHPRCRDSAEVKVMRCGACGLVFLNDSRSISEEFYEKSGMYEFEKPDRAALLLEEAGDTNRRVSLLAPLVKGKRYLDFGCGAGAVVEGLKPLCSEAAAVELNETHRNTLQQLGIKAKRSLAEVDGTFDFVSLFHVLEHLKDPIAELSKIRLRLAPRGSVLVEVPHAGDALLGLYDSTAFKDFTYWTCHLFLFTESTLRATFARAGFKSVKIQFVQRYPLANHLYWLAKGKPGGHNEWAKISSPELNANYAQKLVDLKISDTILAIASMDGE